MSNKQIITDPTIKISPYLYSGDSNKVLLSWVYEKDDTIIMPVSLTGRKNIKELSKKYHNSSYKSSSKLKFIEEVLDLFSKLSLGFSIISPFLILILLAEKVEHLLPENNVDSFVIVSMIYLFLILISLSGGILSILINCFLEERLKENKYNLDKSDREKISQDNFLLISQESPQSLIENAKNTNKYINKIFSFDDNFIKHMDTTELQYYYDDYMRLLTFVSTNHDKISDDLLYKYLNEIEEKSIKVINLAQEMVKIEEEYSQELEKIIKDKEQLQQEMLDNDALRVYYVE